MMKITVQCGLLQWFDVFNDKNIIAVSFVTTESSEYTKSQHQCSP